MSLCVSKLFVQSLIFVVTNKLSLFSRSPGFKTLFGNRVLIGPIFALSMLPCLVVSVPQVSHSSVNIDTSVPQVGWGKGSMLAELLLDTASVCFRSNSLERLQLPLIAVCTKSSWEGKSVSRYSLVTPL